MRSYRSSGLRHAVLLLSCLTLVGCQNEVTPARNDTSDAAPKIKQADEVKIAAMAGIKADLDAIDQLSRGYARALSEAAANHANAASSRMSERLQAMQGDMLYDESLAGGAALRAKWSREEIIKNDAQRAADETKRALDAASALTSELVMIDQSETAPAEHASRFKRVGLRLMKAIAAGSKLGTEVPSGTRDLKDQLEELEKQFDRHIKSYNARVASADRIAA